MTISSLRISNTSRKRFYFYIILLVSLHKVSHWPVLGHVPSLSQPQWSRACTLLTCSHWNQRRVQIRSNHRQFEKMHDSLKENWVTDSKMAMGAVAGSVGCLSKIHFPLFPC